MTELETTEENQSASIQHTTESWLAEEIQVQSYCPHKPGALWISI